MFNNNLAYRITQTDSTGAQDSSMYVAVAVKEMDTALPTPEGFVNTLHIDYFINSPNSPNRYILAGEIRREGNVVYVEDVTPVFLGDPPKWWRWEPLTVETWKGMFPDVGNYEELEKVLLTDADVVNFYIQNFAPEKIDPADYL